MHRQDHVAEPNGTGADREVVHLAKIADQQFEGHPEPRRTGVQDGLHVFAIAASGGRLIEADVFAAARKGDEAGLDLLKSVAVRIDHGGRAALLRHMLSPGRRGEIVQRF